MDKPGVALKYLVAVEPGGYFAVSVDLEIESQTWAGGPISEEAAGMLPTS